MGATTFRQRLVRILKISVGLLLLFLSLRGIDWGQLPLAFKSVKTGWLLGVFATMIAGLFLKIVRWGMLMKRYRLSFPLRRISEAFFFGQVVNIVLPARGGDLLRLGMISSHDPSSVTRVTATLALEKLIDLIALTGIAVGVAAYLPPEASLWLREWLLPVSALAALALTLAIIFGQQIWRVIENRLRRYRHPWIVRAVHLIDRFMAHSLWLRDISNLLPLIAVTLLIWGFMVINSLILFQALSLDIPFSAAGLVLVLGYIRSALQLPPGSVGPFYFFAQLGVTTFGVVPEKALVFAILLHAVVTLSPILVSTVLLLTSLEARELVRSKYLEELLRRSYD